MTGLSLSDAQIKKIIIAAKKHTSVTIRLSKNSLNGPHKLPLTKTQINRMNDAAGGGMNLTLSYEQIKHVQKMISQLQKSGGILPLMALIPIIASALGAAGGLAGGVSSIVSGVKNSNAAAAAQVEIERHNRAVEKQLKEGSGVVSDYVENVPIIGQYLKPLLQKLGMGLEAYNKVVDGGCVKCGKGLFLKAYGEGLYIGPR